MHSRSHICYANMRQVMHDIMGTSRMRIAAQCSRLHHASKMHDISGTSAGQNRLRRRRMLHHASAGHDRNIFPQMPFFLSDLFTVCDKAVSVRFKVITRIIHAHLGYRSAHRIEDDRIELIVSHDQYCISII